MTEPTTEPGKWLVAEYARTPGDPKWYPGLGLESTVIAIEAEAFASLDARYAAQLNLTIKANSTIEDLREELHAAHEHRRVVEEYMAAPDPAPLDECEWCIPRHEWPCPTIPRCDEPGCEDEATCGWPSRPGGTGPNGGYRRTCGPHMREYAKKPQP